MQVVAYIKFQNAFSKVRAIREACAVQSRENVREIHCRKSALYASCAVQSRADFRECILKFDVFDVIAIREATHVTVLQVVPRNLHIALTFDNEFHVNFSPKYSFSKVSAVVYMKFPWFNSHIALTFEKELESTHQTFCMRKSLLQNIVSFIGFFWKRDLSFEGAC